MSVLYWETESVIYVQKRYRRDREEQARGRQSIMRWLELCQEAGSALDGKGAARPAVDTDTFLMVREPFQPVSQMAHLQPDVFFQQDGASPQWAIQCESLNKTFRTDWA
jgi:hypothetical protein